MEIRTLRYFLAIAREENMTSAANVLHVSQSALSRQMLDLEKHLGKQLFVRTNRKTMLTEDGMRLKQRAEEIISLAEQTEKEFQSSDQTVYGEVHIGTVETPAMSLITDIIRKIHLRHPEILFHIYSGNGEEILGRFERGILDFGLLFEPVNTDKYHSVSIPGKDIVGVLMRKDSPYAGLNAITSAKFKEMTLVVPAKKNGSGNPIAFSNWLGTDMDSLHCVVLYNVINNASFVEAGIGNALTIKGLVNTGCESNLKFVPLQPEVELERFVIWKRHQKLSKAAEVFLQEVRKELSIMLRPEEKGA